MKKATKAEKPVSKKTTPAKKPLTASAIIKEVRRLAKEYPEALYVQEGESCCYTSGCVKNGPKTKGCLIGQALRRLGVSLKTLKECDDYSVEAVLEELGIPGPEEKIGWLAEVQYAQDSEMTWKRALRFANDENNKGVFICKPGGLQ